MKIVTLCLRCTMKIFRYSLILILIVSSISLNAQSVSSKEAAQFIDDTVMNMSNQDIVIQVQFFKVFNLNPFSKNDLKKYVMQKQVVRSVNYVLAPKKAITVYREFLKANPSNDISYWLPSGMKITAIEVDSVSVKTKKELSVKIDVRRNNVGDELVKSKKYIVNMLNDNELQVETENMLKS